MLIETETAQNAHDRLGLNHVRVAGIGEVACLDVPFEDVATILSEPLRGEVLRAVRVAGFARVAAHIDGA